MQDNNEQKVRRGDKLSITAATWNNVVDAAKAHKRSRYNPSTSFNSGTLSSLIKSNIEILIKNTSSYDMSESFHIMKLTDPTIDVTEDLNSSNRRLSFDGDIPDDIANPIAILQSPLGIGDINAAVISGVTACKVLMTDDTHKWANPTPGEHGFLTSDVSGQAKILFAEISSDPAEAEAFIYIAIVQLIGIPAVPPTATLSKWKEPVRVKTAVELTGVTYNNGSSGIGATITKAVALPNIDGVTLVNGDRILVTEQNADYNNGIYIVTSTTSPYVLTRATDFDEPSEIASAVVMVKEGEIYADSIWTCIADEPITIGTTTLLFHPPKPTLAYVDFTGSGGVVGATRLFFKTVPKGTYIVIVQISITFSSAGISEYGIGATNHGATVPSSPQVYPHTSPTYVNSANGTITQVTLMAIIFPNSMDSDGTTPTIDVNVYRHILSGSTPNENETNFIIIPIFIA